MTDDAVLDEPVRGDVERGQSVDVRIVLELVRVQEVERGLERDRVVDMVRSGRPMSLCVLHHITTLARLTGYAQEGNLRVTAKTVKTGYIPGDRRLSMELFATIAAIIVGLVGLDLAALRWGTDSRDSLRDETPDWPVS
jgi:hypothetical protein